MGIRSSLSRALVQGWSTFNQEMAVGFAEHQLNVALQREQQRQQRIDSLITGDYTRGKTSANRVTCS